MLCYTLLVRKIFGKEAVEEVTNEDGTKKKVRHFDNEQSEIYWGFMKAGLSILCKILMLVAGFWVTKKKLKISDFFADYGLYEEKNKKYRAPIMISNHITAMDMLMYMQEYDIPSFMAMLPVKKTPIIGKIAESIQTVFVNRKSQAAKTKSLQDVKDRIQNIMEHKRFPRILIFPEGAACNGQE